MTETKCVRISIEDINPTQREAYAVGYTLYTRCTLLQLDGIYHTELTEEIIYFMAVAAYIHHDVKPLIVLDNYLNKLSTNLFWLYLAREKCFYVIMESEMFRRGTTSKLELYSISHKNTIMLQEYERSNIITGFRNIPILHKNNRIFAYNKNPFNIGDTIVLYNQNPMFFLRNHMEYTHINIWTELLQLGAIIAGHFANSIANPVYCFYPILIEDLMINIGLLKKEYKGCANSLSRREIDSTLAYYVQTWDHNKVSPEVQALYPLLQKVYNHYDYHPYFINSKSLYVYQNCVYHLEPIRPTRADLYIIGDNYYLTTQRVIDYLLKTLHEVKIKYAIQYVDITTREFTFRLHKRVCPTLEHSLTAQCLASQEIALCLSSTCKIDVKCTSAYIHAMQYGVNVIMFERNNDQYNRTLMKAYPWGYEPYVVGNILDRFKLRQDQYPNLIVHHALSELLHYASTISYWYDKKLKSACLREYNQCLLTKGEALSDINNDRFLVCKECCHLLEVIHNRTTANIEDVVQIAECLQFAICKFLELNRSKNTNKSKYINFSNLTIALAVYMASRFWIIQYCPIPIDYLEGISNKSNKEEYVYDNTTTDLLIELQRYLPSNIANLIHDYVPRSFHAIFRNIWRLSYFLTFNEQCTFSSGSEFLQLVL